MEITGEDLEWRQELNEFARPRLNDLLEERGLPHLELAEFDTLVRNEPRPSDGDPVAWVEEVTEAAVWIVRARIENTTRARATAGHALDEASPADDPRWGAFAEVLAIEAADDFFVTNWRSFHLRDGLIDIEAAAAFRDQLNDEKQHSLNQVAARLVDADGWWDPEEAALFVLTGAPPAGRRIRTSIVIRDRVGASRITIEADPRASPQAIADSYRKVRSAETLATLNLPPTIASSHRLDGARPNHMTTKNAVLAVHLARNRHARWAQRRIRWNHDIQTAQPDWVYTEDSAFARDASRAWTQVVGEPFNHKHPQQPRVELTNDPTEPEPD